MKCRLIGLSAILFCWGIINNLQAQTTDYPFSKLSIDQGLSNNKVNSIFKDSKGFLWIGTSAGLNRFDGYTCKVFRNNFLDSTTISNNTIFSAFEDPAGKIWVNTEIGLSIYNPQTEAFLPSAANYLRTFSLPDTTFNNIVKDRKGNYWFVSGNVGLFNYSPSVKKMMKVAANPKDSTALRTNNVSDLKVDQNGNVWIIHSNGILERMDAGTRRVQYRNLSLFQENKGVPLAYELYIDADQDLWIYPLREARGVYLFKTQTQSFTHFHENSPRTKLNNNLVTRVLQDNQGLFWISTDHGGINVLDKRSLSIRYLLHNEYDEKSLNQNTVTTLYKDDLGIIWVGTYKKGINYYHEDIFKFPLYRHQLGNAQSLSYDDVNRFAEDARGNLWIGTNGGGLLYFDRLKGTFTQYLHQPGNPNSLSNNVIVSLWMDHEQKLWIGTFRGGLSCFDGTKFIHYKHDPNKLESLSDDSVWEIMEDSRHNLWIGTLSGGLNLFDRQTKQFSHYQTSDMNSIRSNYISALMEDREGNIWIGTSVGIDVLNRQSGRFTHFGHENNQPNSLSNNYILDLHEDKQGRIWVGTSEGLNVFDKHTQQFRAFRTKDGLPESTVLTILEDAAHHLWLSTPNGLSKVQVKPGKNGAPFSCVFNNYNELDGLQGKAFNENAAYQTRKGELIFGGANGFNLFRPELLGRNTLPPQVELIDFQVFNNLVKVGEELDKKVILSRTLAETGEIQLNYDQNVFAIAFAALSYFHPDKNVYAYKLEGFDKDWTLTDSKSRKAAYTNLDPGEYKFRVKASNNDGVWNERSSRLKIVVLPPFWKTKTAFGIYVLLILGALFLIRRLILERANINFRLEQEHQEARRMHELDALKTKFFTNVSHEFRTPLSLIITPLDTMVKTTKDEEQQRHLMLIHRNAKRLLNLVNQLLDFRRLEVQEIKLYATPGEAVQFLKEISYSFSDLYEKKNISFSFHAKVATIPTLFDHDKLERILFNLLSNAFKFTPEYGQVSVEVSLVQPEDNQTVSWLEIRVQDTGIGIPQEKQEKIFERFFQNDVPGMMVNPGSGIGLSITKEFVRLHEGSISVESEANQGSCFLVRLPVRLLDQSLSSFSPILDKKGEMGEEMEEDVDEAEDFADDLQTTTGNRRATILLIEDNEDFRFYLKDNLSKLYTIVEANNGKEGWRQTLAVVPDVIVSDVMMPEMDGIELCRKIKGDPRTSHIPVILLTARAAVKQKLEGFEKGANDYITKPFNFELLQARIKNMVALRESLQKSFLNNENIKPSEIQITSMDQKLLQKVLAVVEANMSNPDFSVEELSREVGISRVYFYKKLLALTGKAPLEYIRIIRLRRAMQLLEQSQMSISEVAYEVGYHTPRNFTKHFKMEYKVLPSIYLAEKKKES